MTTPSSSYPIRSNRYLMSPFINAAFINDVASVEKFVANWHYYIKHDLSVLEQYGKNSLHYVTRKVISCESLPENITYWEAFLLVSWIFRKLRNLNYTYSHVAPQTSFFDVSNGVLQLNPQQVNTLIDETRKKRTSTFQTELPPEIFSFSYIVKKRPINSPLFEELEPETATINVLHKSVGRRPFLHIDTDHVYIVQRFNAFFEPKLTVYRTSFSESGQQSLYQLFSYDLMGGVEEVVHSKLESNPDTGSRTLYLTIYNCETTKYYILKLDLETGSTQTIPDQQVWFPFESALTGPWTIEYLYQNTSYGFTLYIVTGLDLSSGVEKTYLCITRTEKWSEHEWTHTDIFTEMPDELVLPCALDIVVEHNRVSFLNPYTRKFAVFDIRTQQWIYEKKFDDIVSTWITLLPHNEDEVLVSFTGYVPLSAVFPYIITSIQGLAKYVDVSKVVHNFVNSELVLPEQLSPEQLDEYLKQVARYVDISKDIQQIDNIVDDNEFSPLVYYLLTKLMPRSKPYCVSRSYATQLVGLGLGRGINVQKFVGGVGIVDTEDNGDTTTYVDITKVLHQLIGTPLDDDYEEATLEYELNKYLGAELSQLYLTPDVEVMLEHGFNHTLEPVLVNRYEPFGEPELYVHTTFDFSSSRGTKCACIKTYPPNLILEDVDEYASIQLASKLGTIWKTYSKKATQTNGVLMHLPEFKISWYSGWGCGRNISITVNGKGVTFENYPKFNAFLVPSGVDDSIADNYVTIKRQNMKLLKKYLEMFSCVLNTSCVNNSITKHNPELVMLETLNGLEQYLSSMFPWFGNYLQTLSDIHLENIMLEILYYVALYVGLPVDPTLMYTGKQAELNINLLSYFTPIHTRTVWVEEIASIDNPPEDTTSMEESFLHLAEPEILSSSICLGETFVIQQEM